MGILDWVQGRKDEGEMVPLTDLDSEDGDGVVQKGRPGDGNIKRRRHHVNKGTYFSSGGERRRSLLQMQLENRRTFLEW